MLKSALFVFCSAALLLVLTGCDSGTTPSGTGSGEAAQLPPGITGGQEPDPSQIPTVERPGGNLGKSTSGEK